MKCVSSRSSFTDGHLFMLQRSRLVLTADRRLMWVAKGAWLEFASGKELGVLFLMLDRWHFPHPSTTDI